MMKLLSLILLLPLLSFADDFSIDANAMMDNLDEETEIVGLVIEADPTQNPSSSDTRVEIYRGFLDLDVPNEAQINWLKNAFNDEHRVNGSFQSIATILKASDEENIDATQAFIARVIAEQTVTQIDTVPERLHDSFGPEPAQTEEDQGRTPNSILQDWANVGRSMVNTVRTATPNQIFWSLVRTVSGSSGVYMAMYAGSSLTMTAGIMSALPVGITSGGLTFFNNVYGDILNSGKWSNFLYNHRFDVFGVRQRTDLAVAYFENLLIENRENLLAQIPELSEFPEVFQRELISHVDTEIRQAAVLRKAEILKRFAKGEAFLKWGLMEVFFVGALIKLPATIQEVIQISSTFSAGLDVLSASGMAMMIQAPFELALHTRREQRIVELRDAIVAGTIAPDNSETLLRQLNQVISGEVKLGDIRTPHKLLRRISNRSMMEMTLLSLVSLTTTTLKLSPNPHLAYPIAVAMTTIGSAYYAHVHGMLKRSDVRETVLQRHQRRILESISDLKANYCQRMFMPTLDVLR